MTITLSSLAANTQTWAQAPSTADVSVTVDGAARTLTGMAAAAYLFGQALTTVQFQDTLDGVQLSDARFEFPPASGQRVPLAEVANALRYKYGVDPLIEFAPGLGLRGYSVADINRILELLNREFAGQFSLTPLSSTAVLAATQLVSLAAGLTVAYTATDAVADTITFINDPIWPTGMLVQVPTTGGGLTAGTDYFVRNLTGGQYALFTAQADASGTGDTGRVNLTANIATTVSPIPAVATTATDTDTTADTITFFNDPGWTTGLPVRPQTAGGGLQTGVDYFVRNLTGGKYAFFTDQADASGTGTTGQVDLNADISTTVLPITKFINGTATNTANDTVTFLNDPGWATGVRVQVDTAGAGLRTGTEYFVRNLTGGKYAFFTTQEAASGTGQNGRVDLLSDVSATVRDVLRGSATGFSGTSFQASSDPNFATGTQVQVSSAGGGLTVGDTYFVRNQGGGNYQLYTSAAAAAAGGGGASLVTWFAGGSTAFVTFALVRSGPGATVEDDWVSFPTDPNWSSGTLVRVNRTGGGLIPGVDYFVRNLGSGRYEFFKSAAAASGTGTSDLVDLRGNVVLFSTISPHPSSATVDGDWATFPTNPTWPTGTRVQVSTTGGGLTAGVDYFVRDLTGGRYAFFTDQAAASGTGTAGRVNLIAGASITLSPSPSSATVDDDWVTFSNDPIWANGTPVRVSTTGGGLTAGVDYFVRSLGSGRYDFFTSQASAAGTSNADRVSLTGSIGAVSRYDSDSVLSTLLNTASTPILAGATDTELRQNLTEGGDLYTDRFGAFYLKGVRTQAMDVAVTSRLLVQDNVSAEYKLLMDELAERNNLIAAARSAVAQIDSATTKPIAEQRTALAANLANLSQLYGYEDILSEKLTAGQIAGREFPKISDVVDYLTELQSDINLRLLPALEASQVARISQRTSLEGDILNYKNLLEESRANIVDLGASLSLATSQAEYEYIQGQIDSEQNQIYEYELLKERDEAALVRLGGDEVTNLQQIEVATVTRDGLTVLNLSVYQPASLDELLTRLAGWKSTSQTDLDKIGLSDPLEYFHLNYNATGYESSAQWSAWVAQRGDETNTTVRAYTTAAFSALPAPVRSNDVLNSIFSLDATGLADLKALLNTLISNKVRDGDLDQAKLQTLTAQLQNNTEAMTALIKAFTEMNAQLAQALR